jgi:superfamily I DNA/RNA helicase
LSICYRCPTSHIKLAQQIVPSIEARQDALEGILEEVKRDTVPKTVQEGDLIISRRTAPVIKLCIELIAKRIPARVRGRDIGKSLTTIVKEVAKHPNFHFDEFGTFLKDYEEVKVAKLEQKKNAQSQIESLRDRIQGIEVCYEAFDVDSVEELCFEIESLFSDGRASVMLSTVHRAKGLENERVFILEPDKLPLRWQGQQEWELTQEFNLKYVALTRAKHALYFIK